MKNFHPTKMLVIVASVVFALLLGETAARWLLPGWFRQSQTHASRTAPDYVPPINVYDPEIGWVLSPESIKSHHVLVPSVVFSIDHNERLTSLQPPSGPRIVATGCSFTFGQSLPDQDTWPWLLQERLPDYHVVNVGAMGYGTDQALLAAEREIARFPGSVRTVVLGFADFQIDRNRCPQSWLSKICPFAKPRFMQTGTGVQYKEQIRFWSLGSVADSLIDRSFLLSSISDLVTDHVVHRIEPHDGGRELTVALITDFARRFQARRSQLVVVVLPHLLDQSPQSKVDRAFITAQLRAAGVPTLVMDIPRLPDGRLPPHGFTVGGHPNRQYNLLLADQLVKFLNILSTSQESSAKSRH